MGNLDAVTKEYLKFPDVVADIANFMLYGGEQRILPERLHEMDTTVLTVPYGADHAALPAQKFRDRLVAMADESNSQMVSLFLGDEAEAKIHYAEPVKSLYYDAAHYASQVSHAGASRKAERREKREALKAEEIRKKIISRLKAEGWSPQKAAEEANQDIDMEEVFRMASENLVSLNLASGEAAAALEDSTEVFSVKKADEGKLRPTSGEFLGNFYKNDRLVPAITIVLHLSPEYWDGPRSLREMFGEVDEALLPYLPDYHINLISPAELTEEDFLLFRTDLREVLRYIKYSKDKEKIQKLIENGSMRNVRQAALDVINKATNSIIPYVFNEKGECDMCSGLKELLEDERAEGRTEEKVACIKNVMESFEVSCENAMKALKISEADFPKYRAMM